MFNKLMCVLSCPRSHISNTKRSAYTVCATVTYTYQLSDLCKISCNTTQLQQVFSYVTIINIACMVVSKLHINTINAHNRCYTTEQCSVKNTLYYIAYALWGGHVYYLSNSELW